MKEDKARILIVDDETANIDILLEIFKGKYFAMVAKEGEQALNLLAKQTVDLILLDIMMPGLDGFETCRRLKAQAATKEIPVIFITSMSEHEDEAIGLALGAVDYITKPFSPPVVKVRVQTHIRLKQAHDELTLKNSELQKSAILREQVEQITRHDLMTPIGGIINYPKMLIKRLDPDPQSKEMLVQIAQSGQQVLDLVNLFLDQYKMEMGNYVFRPEPTDLLAIIAQIEQDLSAVVDCKGLSLQLRLEGKRIEGDKQFLVEGKRLLCYSILANLTKNAMEAAPEDSEIAVSLSRVGQESEFRIHNLGAIPAEIRSDFFGKFNTAGKSHGTGLGTYSAKLITEAQGGSIDVHSSEEEGTTLYVRFKTWSSEVHS